VDVTGVAQADDRKTRRAVDDMDHITPWIDPVSRLCPAPEPDGPDAPPPPDNPAGTIFLDDLLDE
jgi:hypothetical protein